MSSDEEEEEYANHFIDDEEEDISLNLQRSVKSEQYSGSQILRLMFSSDSGLSTGKFALIFKFGDPSHEYNSPPRSKHTPLTIKEVESEEDTDKGDKHSGFLKTSDDAHNICSNHSDNSFENLTSDFTEKGQRKIEGHVNKARVVDSAVKLNENSKWNEKNENELSGDEGGDDKVKGKSELQRSKVNSFSLVDNKPIAEMFKKDCDKRDDIIKTIWSGSSKYLSGQGSVGGQIDKQKIKQTTDGDKSNSGTKQESDQRNFSEIGQRSVGEQHNGNTERQGSVEEFSLPPKIKSVTENNHELENKSVKIKPSDEVTMVTKIGSKNLDSSLKEFPEKMDRDLGKVETSWNDKLYARIHMRNKEESLNSIEEDGSPLSLSKNGKTVISNGIASTGMMSNNMARTGLISDIRIDTILRSHRMGNRVSNSDSISDNTNNAEPLTLKIQNEGINNMSLNRIITNEKIRTDSLFAIRDSNAFGQISQPILSENNFIKATQESRKTWNTEKPNTGEDQASNSQRSRSSNGSTRRFNSLQDEDPINQSPVKPQRSNSSNGSAGLYNFPQGTSLVSQPPVKPQRSRPSAMSSSFPEEKEFDFGSRLCVCGHCYKNEDGSKRIKTAVSRMQKMMTGMETFADERGFQICDVSNDGNCMFSAVVDQLNLFGEFRYTTTSLRHSAVKYLEQNPCHEDGSHLSSFLDHESWEEYLTRMDRDAEWGDHLILTAIVEVIQRCITVYNVSPTTKSDTTLKPSRSDSKQSEILYLGHYGEEHFVSLRPNNWESTWYNKDAAKATLPKNAGISEGQNLEGQGANVNVGQQTTDILKNRFGIDPISGIPLPHLSFIIKILLQPKYITTSQNLYKLKLEPSSKNERRMVITGTAIENLDFNLSDFSYYTKCSCSRDPNQINEDEILGILVDQTYKVGFPERAVLDRCDLMINTMHTHSGYVRLEPVSQRYNFRKCVKHVESSSFLKPLLKAECSDLNTVYGLELHDMLSVISEWIWRDRPSKWPSSSMIQEITHSGCVLAAKAHPASTDPEIEWQVLFPEAEKILATKALSNEQKYCFSVLKGLVDCQTRELKDKFSTNHLKSIFYFSCEIVPATCWHDNIGGILLYLIEKLLESLREGQLPNYFIKENNMIDHFSIEGRQLLEEKIKAIRLFPVMSMLFIGKRHSILCSSAIDSIVDDFDRYRSEGGFLETIQTVFVPSMMKLAESQSHYGIDYQQMYNTVSSAYDELSVLSKSESSVKVPEFSEFFLKLFLSEKSETKRFVGAFCLDSQYQTSMNSLLYEGTDTKTLQEVVGTEVEEKFKNLKIPVNMVSTTVESVNFFDKVAYQLYLRQDYENSAYFLRFGIAKVKKELNNKDTNLTEIDDDDVKSDIAKQIYFQMQQLNMLYYEMLSHLYICYVSMRQHELFLEYMEDLEELSDRMGDSSVYKWISELWEKFGSKERANIAKSKMQAIEDNSNGNSLLQPDSKRSAFLLFM